MHYAYVVNKASVPTTMKAAPDFRLDLGGAKSGTPDGTVDNRLGELLGTLAGMGFAIQDTINAAINQGHILMLVDFQTKDFMNTSATGFTIKLGANPVPAACNGATDPVCGHHLTGTAAVSIAASSPADTPIVGQIVDGMFNGGPGDISLQIVLSDAAQPLTLSLQNARAKATAITDAGMMATVGGALSFTDLNTQVIPAITAQLAELLVRDCGPLAGRTGPSCSCMAGSTSQTLLDLFDSDLVGTSADCNITNEEVAGNVIIKSLTGPDVCRATSCTAPDALSLGIKVTTVKATIN